MKYYVVKANGKTYYTECENISEALHIIGKMTILTDYTIDEFENECAYNDFAKNQ